MVKPHPAVSGDIVKGQLPGGRPVYRHRRFFPGPVTLKDKLYPGGPRLMELVLDEIKVVFHDPVAGELVGAVEDNGLVGFFQKPDGVDPQREGVFWQLRSNLFLDVFPDGLHEKAPDE
jgi:hypothetical protein